MSRKDLSRTVIEGGRSHYNHFDRDQSHRDERATAREWLDRVRVDVDVADDTLPEQRRKVGKSFHDKLGPTRRWLRSRVGRPWNAVYSELCRTFDRRSLAGMHVVDAHIVGEVRRHAPVAGEMRYWPYDYIVDDHGILRRSRVQGREFRGQRKKLERWLDGCRASLTYRGWWWLRITITSDRRTLYAWDRPLTKGDLRRIARLPDELRHLATIASPFR